MCHASNEKWQTASDGMKLPNQDKIRTLGEKKTNKYLGIKQVDMKEKLRQNISGELESHLRQNYLAIPGLYPSLESGPFLKWTRVELKQRDQRTRNLMTMHKALYPRDDFERLYVSRKEGGRGLANTEDSVDASMQGLEDYVKKHEGGLISAIRNDTDNMIDIRMTITRKQKWEEKQLYGRFKRLIYSYGQF